MEYLTDKSKIAKAMIKHAVVKINMESAKEGYANLYEGDTVKVLCPSERHPDLFLGGKLMYCDGSFYVSNPGAMITNSFGYTDVMDMTKVAQAPVIKADANVVIIEDYPYSKQCRVALAKVSKVNSMCMEACKLL